MGCTKDLDPSFERNKWEIRPENCKEAVENKDCEPGVLCNNLRQANLSLVKNVDTRERSIQEIRRRPADFPPPPMWQQNREAQES